MSTIQKTFVLGLFLLINACGAGAVTASSRMAESGGGGGGAGFVTPEANSPPNVEARVFERPVYERSEPPVREVPFRIERDCWACR